MFGEIRSLLQSAPSPKRWEQLCQHVSEWSERDELEGTIIPYILSHVQEWPHAYRRSPLRWKDGLVRGADLPFGALVKVLDASRMRLHNEDLLTLARAPIMAHVEALDLSRNLFGWRGLMHLLEQSAHVSNLRALDLTHTGVGVEGLRLLAQTPELSQLEVLRLDHVQCSPRGLEALMASEHLKRLHTLTLCHNGLSERHIAALVCGERFTALRALALDGNPLGSRGALRLFRRRLTERLEALSLAECEISTPTAQVLAQARALGALKQLRVSGNPLAYRAEVFASSASLSHLEELDLRADGRERHGVEQLLERGAPSALKRLALSSLALSPALRELAQDQCVELTTTMPLDLGLLGLADVGLEVRARALGELSTTR